MNHYCQLCCMLVALFLNSCTTTRKEQFVTSLVFPEGITVEEKARLAGHVVPSSRQLEWQRMQFTAFVCYGINTFTDKEWGTGKEDPLLFDPEMLDARQWAHTIKDAGMKMLLLTCKHHDGFCLWPSRFTDFSVASSPWKDGNGDLVKEVSDACREFDLRFAVYLSPWDMNHPDYGTDKYNDYFVNQLTELLTNYGRVDEVWFDGACGEGPNGKKQVYDFKRYYQVIRQLQPHAVIAVMGPDVRWVGTESGYGRDTEWSVVPASAANLEELAASSQQEPGNGTFLPEGDQMSQDLGSRDKLAGAKGVIWYPSEVDVSIRPGWYYHPAEDSLVKSPQKLVDIYYSSVGRNSLLLLNLPPDKRGLIHDTDIRNLMEMQRILKQTFAHNLLENATTTTFSREDLTDGQLQTCWTGQGRSGILEIFFAEHIVFDRLVLQENITAGQRVERFVLECWIDNKWKKITGGTTIGYKRILRFDPVKCEKVRLTIMESRDTPLISELGIYKSSLDEHPSIEFD